MSNKTRCDGKFDCKSGADEMGCPKVGCTFGACSQICVEKKGVHYNCKCVSGYVKGSLKNASCVALDDKQKLLTASEDGLRIMAPNRIHEGTHHVEVAGMNMVKIKSMDYLLNNDGETIVFWIDYATKRLQRVKLKYDGKKKGASVEKRVRREEYSQDVLTIVEDLEDPVALAVDHISQKLYVIDGKSEAIVVMDLDGRNRKNIVYTGRYPTELILDLENRNLIWTTKMKSIMVASMDGAEKKALVSHDVEWASGLAIDYPTGRLYWVDQRKATVETSLLNGSDVHYVWQLDETAKPQKLDVFEDSLYVTLYNQSIIKVNKFGYDNIESELQGNQKSFVVRIVHPLKQYLEISNPCANNLTACDGSAICLLSSANGSRRTCTCPDSMHKTVKEGVRIEIILEHVYLFFNQKFAFLSLSLFHRKSYVRQSQSMFAL